MGFWDMLPGAGEMREIHEKEDGERQIAMVVDVIRVREGTMSVGEFCDNWCRSDYKNMEDILTCGLKKNEDIRCV